MISLTLARELKAAGLVWRATINDFFAIPERGMDERVFVLADMQAQLDIFRGWPVVTFHGTAEWALDYILTTEVVWMPREEQLRDALFSLLANQQSSDIGLHVYPNGAANCSIQWNGQAQDFTASTAADAYGRALLHVLQGQRST